MNEIIKHPEFGEIRTVTRKGEPWFSAQDVCAVLGHSNHRKAVADMVDDDEKGVTKDGRMVFFIQLRFRYQV